MAFDAIETPFGSTGKIVGGAATYISLCASYFTDKLGAVSVIGGDFPNEYLEILRKKHVNLEGVELRPKEKTFFWSGKYHMDMNTRDTLVTELNVLGDFKPKVPEKWKKSKYVMLGNLSPQVQLNVIEQMETRPKLIGMDTMNFWMDIAREDLLKTIAKVDVLFINDEEARQLSGEYSLVKAARVIREMGPEYLVIKKGEHGALLFFHDNIFYAPALPLEEVFDPTGAGDTFAGGFMGWMASSNSVTFDNMKSAVIYGSAMASFCVEKFGTERMQNLSLDEIKKRVAQFKELVRF